MRLDDIRSLVRAHVHKVDQMRTYNFLQQASLGDIETLRNMLNQGISPSSADYDGRTALMLSSAAGHEVCWHLAGSQPFRQGCIKETHQRPLRKESCM